MSSFVITNEALNMLNKDLLAQLALAQADKYLNFTWLVEDKYVKCSRDEFTSYLDTWRANKSSVKAPIIKLLLDVEENYEKTKAQTQNEAAMYDAMRSKVQTLVNNIEQKDNKLLEEVITRIDRLQLEEKASSERTKQLFEKVQALKINETPVIKQLFDDKNDRVHLKITDLPKFSGNLGENFGNWLYLVENFQKAGEIENSQMITRVIPILRGHALDMLIR